jgi:hypothetical protein
MERYSRLQLDNPMVYQLSDIVYLGQAGHIFEL